MNLRLRSPLALLSALTFGLLFVTVSDAAFSAPFYASPSKQDASSADVGMDGSGNAIFSWVSADPTTHDEIVQARERTAGGTLSQTQTLSTTGHDAVPSPHIAVTANGTAIAVWQLDHGDASAKTPIQGRARSAAGALGPIFTVSAAPGGAFSYGFANPKVGVGATGGAVFLWAGLDGNGQKHAYARRRSAGGVLGPTLMLSPAGVTDPRMAVNASGAAIFVWAWNNNNQNYIEARQLTAGGVLGPIKILAVGYAPEPGGGLGTVNPQAAEDSQGNAYVVWEQPDSHGPCGIHGCPKVLGRSVSASGVVGSVPQTFTTTTSGGFSPQIAMAGNGNAVVEWVHGGIEVRTRSSAGTLGPLQKFSIASGLVEPVLKGDPAGDVVAAWKNGTVIQARARTAGGVVGQTRTFSIGGQTAGGGTVAVGSGGNAVVAWAQSDGLGQCQFGSSCSRVGASVGP